MHRNPALETTPRAEEVRFQLSLLHLLYPSATPSPQQAELEQLLNLPAKLAPVH